MRWKKNNALIAFALMISFSVAGQQFRHTATIDSITQSGFYAIEIGPSISKFIRTDLIDLRIADEKGQWVPHIIDRPYSRRIIEVVSWEVPISKIESIGERTILVLSNLGKEKISNFSLEVKNTSANRFASLSGSDDQQNWYTITDSILLKNAESGRGDNPRFEIYFPEVNYKYFRVTILNGKNDPLNIKQVYNLGPGMPDTNRRFIPNPLPRFSRSDTAGYSLIKIENTDSFHINKIILRIASPIFFERQAHLYTSWPGNFKTLFQSNSFRNFILSTNHSGEYIVPLFKAETFYILVENADNPPLQLRSVQTEQDYRHIIAYLEKDKHYHLSFGDPLARAPNYDLTHFKDRIPSGVPFAKIGTISSLPVMEPALAGKNFKWWIWPAIIIVIVLLAVFTMSLTRDMKRKQVNE